MDLPITLLARQWRDPPDDFEDLVARTKTTLDSLMDRIDGSDEGVDFRAHRLIAGSLIDLLDTVTSTGRKPTRIGSGIAKALEALLHPDSRKECIGTVNELRGMLSTPMLSESSFFTLAPSAERLTQSLPDPDILDRIKSVVGEGQREFQRGLWEWVSGNPGGLKRIASVLVAIDEAAQGRHPLWRIAARFSILMAEENASPGHALTRLVGQIDHQIRRFCAQACTQGGHKAERPPEALLHNLLFHIEAAGVDSETARSARSDFGLGRVFEIPEARTGWPAAARSKTMNLLLRVSASLEESSSFHSEIGRVRRDLIRARDAMSLAGRPDIARRTNRAVECLGDPQTADPRAAAGIVREVCEALERQSPAAVDLTPDPQDAVVPAPPDLSKIPDFSRAKELMDRIDAAFATESGLDEGDPIEDAPSPAEPAAASDGRRGSDRSIDGDRYAASPSPSAFDEKLHRSEGGVSSADSSSIPAKDPLPRARGISSEPSDIERIPDGVDDEHQESERRGSENAFDEPGFRPPGPDEAREEDPFKARRWGEGEEAPFARDDSAPGGKPSSWFDPKDSALDILFERIHAHGDTQRKIAVGMRRLGQGIERLEVLARIDAPPPGDGRSEKTEGIFEGSGLRCAADSGEIEKARRSIPVLRAIAAHIDRLSERGQREGMALEKTVSGLRLVPLDIGIRRIRAIATRPRADGKRLSIDVRGEERRCDPAVLDHLFPIIESVIETVIEQVIEPPSHDLDRSDNPPARLGLDFSLRPGSMTLSVIAQGRVLGSTGLAKIRDRIDKARGELEILPAPRDRFVGLRIELPLTRWLDNVVVGRLEKERFALFARDVVAILRPDDGRTDRRQEGRFLESGVLETRESANPLDARKRACRDIESADPAISKGLEREGFEYEGDIWPWKSLRPLKNLRSLKDLSPIADQDDARPAEGDRSAQASSRAIVLLRVGEKRAALLCDGIESADECTLCALPPLVAEFGSTAVVFADLRPPAVLIEGRSVIENDTEEGSSLSTATEASKD